MIHNWITATAGAGWLPLRDHEDYGESTMHIETELDDVYAERLVELQKHLNKPLPQLVAEMLAKVIDETPVPVETEGQKVLRILEAHQLLGCMEGDSSLSVDYKKHLWGNP